MANQRKKVRKEKTQKSKSSRPYWNEKNKKRTLFDEKHQVKNKTNTTKKSSWLYSDQKVNAQLFRKDP